ncbi:MAG: helix-turn-helix domain-containing protein [Actinobacteria bacterium]|nr:helix-turn-helix domain-containing protein [Actinomycetota bacterium]
MPSSAEREQQSAFATAVATLLRQSRRSQRLTQTEVADRTAGAVSKAALANYETGHRSLRIDVFWAIAKALGEDPGGILAAAERASGFGTDAAEGPITVDVEAIRDSVDPRLAPVRRWFGMRLQAGGARLAVRTITLDFGALAALAELMGVSAVECRRILAQAGTIPRDGSDTGTSSYPPAAVG